MTRERRWLYHFLIKAGMKRLPIFIYLSVLKVWFSVWFISLGWQGSPIKNKVLLRHVPWWWSGISGEMLCREIENCQLPIIQDLWLKVTNRNILFGSKEHFIHFRIRVILITISAGIISCARLSAQWFSGTIHGPWTGSSKTLFWGSQWLWCFSGYFLWGESLDINTMTILCSLLFLAEAANSAPKRKLSNLT